MEKFNIAKYLSRSGVCSRRESEEMVANGQIAINGKIELNPARNVEESDSVTINGIDLRYIKSDNQIKLYAIHKPKGCLVTMKDAEGRKTVFDLIPKSFPRLISIGRLDFNSEGVLLLTNYGPLARYFELPSNQIKRVYEVKLFGQWNDSYVKILQQGIKIQGFQYKPMKINVLYQKNKQTKVKCVLTEGKNLELRKIFQHLGLTVSKLKRISYGDFKLGSLPQGHIVEYPKSMVKLLMNQIEKASSLDKHSR